MARKYVLTKPRLQPLRNVSIDGKEKFCTKCKTWKGICYDNLCIDSKRGDGRSLYRSHCRPCLRESNRAAILKKKLLQDILGN